MVKGNSRFRKMIGAWAILNLLVQVFLLADLKADFPTDSSTVSNVISIQLEHADQVNESPTLSDHSENHHHDSQSSHHHCKHCSAGMCCANVGESISVTAPLLSDEKYQDSSSFWFYELISSQLRPPSLIS